MQNVSQVANSFKMDLYYCLVVNKRKKKKRMEVLSYREKLDYIEHYLLNQIVWQRQVSFQP